MCPKDASSPEVEYLMSTSLRCTNLVRTSFCNTQREKLCFSSASVQNYLISILMSPSPYCIIKSNTHWQLDNNNILYSFFLRKEVIQPHLPIRLPCYDFTPVISSTFDSSFQAVTTTVKLCFTILVAARLGHWLRAFPTPMV